MLKRLLQALREKAKADKDLEVVLRKYGLLAILIGFLLSVGLDFSKEAGF